MMQSLAEKLYNEAITHYNNKKKAMVEQTMPIIRNIRKEQGNHIENVAVPFTDGKKGIQAMANLDKYFETEGRN
jgi:preprotein translocase subunit SecA